MKTIIFRIAGLALVLWLSACAALPPHSQPLDYFPGGSPYYSYGVSQSRENFANVARAQYSLGLYKKQITWQDMRPEVAPSSNNMLQVYLPLSVRWQLKDGRQFIAENINVRGIMAEYFKSHDLAMPWQREGRAMDGKGDYEPSLVHEIRDDVVIIKWLIKTNHTPVNDRFTSSGAATRWKLTDQEFTVTEIKGTPTRGINFDRWVEIIK